MDTENGIMLFVLTDIGAANAKTADEIAKAKAALQAEKAAPEITALGSDIGQHCRKHRFSNQRQRIAGDGWQTRYFSYSGSC